MVWLQFIVCAGFIVVAGNQLSHYGDVLAEKSGLGRSWIGAVLLASVTSLPELITGTSAIALVGEPDLAVGGILGSCLFNLVLLALLDLIYQPRAALNDAHEGHTLSAGFGILLIGLTSTRLLAGKTWHEWTLGWVAPTSLVILLVYLASQRMLFAFEQRSMANGARDMTTNYTHIATRRAVIIFSLAALAIVALGVWLAFIGEDIARTTGLDASFVGNVFLAISTSLPEVVVTIAAARMKAVDLAVGNVLGSNVFNIAILAVYDFAYTRGSIWEFVSPIHAVAGLGAIVMTAVAIISLTYRASTRVTRHVTWDAALLIALYLANVSLLYLLGSA
ncbi:MAG: sodium:calcium antiporter [Chloroflexi bacterium]|nr:sodium:calcium antiporter [Chloroflexota bacterium]